MSLDDQHIYSGGSTEVRYARALKPGPGVGLTYMYMCKVAMGDMYIAII